MITRSELIKIGIILIFWVFMWFLYNICIRPLCKDPFYGDPFSTHRIELPDCMKCYFKNISTDPKKNDCTNEAINGWSFGHILIYFSLGLFCPNMFTEVIIISILCEVWEYYAGWRARWLLDPITNIVGYLLGIWCANYWKPAFPVKFTNCNPYLVMVLVILIFVMQINKPALLKPFVYQIKEKIDKIL
jgi:hypothetical protein